MMTCPRCGQPWDVVKCLTCGHVDGETVTFAPGHDPIEARPLGKTGIAIGRRSTLDERGAQREQTFEEFVDRKLRQREGDQPLPIPNDRPHMHDLLIEDIQARKALGTKRYGTPLQPFNGRNSLRDAYEESLDNSVYLRTKLFEEEHAQMRLDPRNGSYTFADDFGRVWTLRRSGVPDFPFIIELVSR